ncbi:aquaporin TIP4-2 isoform X2 [Setaria italica]|uniref:aquaporin TIP4-2 isoform X2 n=1 Tax=Setaria italica TaxID=4555 RepID=UPI000350A72D|nr:aquaporin TIP4-2 isoform X2 [Setaria italica]
MATKLMQKFVDSCDDGGDAGQQDAGCVRAVLAELVLTFLFVFTVVSAAMAAGSGVKAGEAMPMAALAAVAITNALAAGVLVTAGFHVSGGHLNPAVTVAMMVRGHLSKLRTVLYVAAQLLASSLACILLRYLTGGMVQRGFVALVAALSASVHVYAVAAPQRVTSYINAYHRPRRRTYMDLAVVEEKAEEGGWRGGVHSEDRREGLLDDAFQLRAGLVS